MTSIITLDAHTVLALIDVEDALIVQLPPRERAMCASWGIKRQRTFAAGRTALRTALAHVGLRAGNDGIDSDDRGAPVVFGLARDVGVSITHKDSVAGAIVCTDMRGGYVGVDLEIDEPRSDIDVSGLIEQTLVDAEQQALPQESALRRRRWLELFSAKEALYKSLDPFVRRYVGFREVTATRGADASLRFVLPEPGLSSWGTVHTVGRPDLVITSAHTVRL